MPKRPESNGKCGLNVAGVVNAVPIQTAACRRSRRTKSSSDVCSRALELALPHTLPMHCCRQSRDRRRRGAENARYINARDVVENMPVYIGHSLPFRRPPTCRVAGDQRDQHHQRPEREPWPPAFSGWWDRWSLIAHYHPIGLEIFRSVFR